MYVKISRGIAAVFNEEKYKYSMSQAIRINLIMWCQWCKEEQGFIVHFTFQWWFDPIRKHKRLQTL